MHLVYYSNNGTEHLLTTFISLLIVIGAIYGCARLCIDAIHLIRRWGAFREHERSVASHRQEDVDRERDDGDPAGES